MSVRRWAYIAFGLFVLCGLGLAAGSLPRVAAARNLQPQNVSAPYTYDSRGAFSFDVEVSIPLTTPTPFATYTRTPGTATATTQPDLTGYFEMQQGSCVFTAAELRTNAISGNAGPSTMRFQGAGPEEQIYFPVRALNAGQHHSAYCGECIHYTPPFTLTVDVFDNVAETNEGNNITTMANYPPIWTHCATWTPTFTPTRTRTPTVTATPTITNTPIATPTGINQCYINVTEASTTCTQPDTYSYEFQLDRNCSLNYRVNLYLDVAPDVGGPWVTVAERIIPDMSGPVIEGSFVENVSPEHRYYQIRVEGHILATGRPFDGVKETEVTHICGRPLPCPLSWNARAPYPIEIRDHAAASLGDYLYSFGGRISLAEVNNAYRYNPGSDNWISIASMPGVRRGASAVAGDGYVYVVNGWNGSSATNTLFRYDPATNTHSTGPAGLMATSYQAAAFLNGKVYRIGGLDASANTTASVEIYGEQMVAPLPEPLSSAMAVSMNGYIYVAGGVAPAGVSDKTYRYDPASNTWDDAAIADLPVGRNHAASGILDGKWVLAGGTAVGQASAVAWDPATNTWSSITPMLYERGSLAGDAAGDAFYTVGGVDNSGSTNTTQEYAPAGCPSPTPTTTSVTATSTSTAFATPTFTATPVEPTPCSISFTDLPPSSTFYASVRCLACRGILGGYGNGTFRPNNDITRGQLSKIVANSAGFYEPVSEQIFQDVPVGSPFYTYIERMARRGILGGYPCGTVPYEPCGTSNKPYFRPGAHATRGQISKIVSNAKGFNDPPGEQIFEDVPPGSTFYEWVQRLASRGIIGGYPCGGPGEPCGVGNKPYFRPNRNATRGQVSKMVANTFFPGCETRLRP